MALSSTQHRLQVEQLEELLCLMGTITISSLIHRCLNWKNESLVLFLYSTVRAIGCRIQDQNNQVHNRLRNLVQAHNLHQLLNQPPSNPIDEKLVKQVIRKVADGYVFEENGILVIFLPRNFQQKLQQPLIVN